MKILGCGLLLLALVFVTGCADTTKQEALMQDMIKNMNEMADTLESMKDNPSEENIKACQAKLAVLADKMEANAKAVEKLPKAAQDRLEKKFKTEIESAKARMEKAQKSIQGLIK